VVDSAASTDSKVSEGEEFMIDRKMLRLTGVLLLAGFMLSLVAGLLHPGREPANNHRAVFAEYASNANWTAVHLGQFAGMAVIIAGLLALYFALDVRTGNSAWLARFGGISAAVALGLYGVLQRWTGSLSSRLLMLGRAHRKRRRWPVSPALRRSGGWNGGPEAIRASCSVSR
jgi:hypothetical protein